MNFDVINKSCGMNNLLLSTDEKCEFIILIVNKIEKVQYFFLIKLNYNQKGCGGDTSFMSQKFTLTE